MGKKGGGGKPKQSPETLIRNDARGKRRRERLEKKTIAIHQEKLMLKHK